MFSLGERVGVDSIIMGALSLGCGVLCDRWGSRTVEGRSTKMWGERIVKVRRAWEVGR